MAGLLLGSVVVGVPLAFVRLGFFTAGEGWHVAEV
jgi:hypothetical protein